MEGCDDCCARNDGVGRGFHVELCCSHLVVVALDDTPVGGDRRGETENRGESGREETSSRDEVQGDEKRRETSSRDGRVVV